MTETVTRLRRQMDRFSPHDGRVFLNADGNPVSSNAYSRVFRRAKAQLWPKGHKLAKVVPYDLRHSAAVAVSWFAFAAAMLGGLWAYERRRYSLAALGLAVGASSGLVTLLHFVEVPPGDMDWFQLVGVAIDFVGGVAMLTAAAWVAWWGPRRAAP